MIDWTKDFYVEGLEDLQHWLEVLPENADKITRKALRAGGNAVKRRIVRRVPQKFRKMVRSKVFKGKSSHQLQVLVGLYNTHETNGKTDIDRWFKAYWLNYGTLDNRDPEHHFLNPVKKKRIFKRSGKKRGPYGKNAIVKQRVNPPGMAGIPRRNFFEKAIEGYWTEFRSAFEKSIKKQEKDFYDR